MPELVAAVLENFALEHVSDWSRSAWPAADLGPGRRNDLVPLGRARLVCRLWAAEGLCVQWRSATAGQLARVAAPDAQRRLAALVVYLDADFANFGGIANAFFPRLRELRSSAFSFNGGSEVELCDLLSRCGSDGGGANGGDGASAGGQPTVASLRSSPLRLVRLYMAPWMGAFLVSATLLSHLAHHPQLRRMHIGGILTGAVLAQASSAVAYAGDGASAAQGSAGVPCLFRQLCELKIAVTPDVVAMLLRLLACDAREPFTDLSIQIKGDLLSEAVVPQITAFADFGQNLRHLSLSFDLAINPRLSASDLDCLRSLTQLTQLSLSDCGKPVEASPDLTRAKLTALLATLGIRLRSLKLFVAASWLTSNASLKLFGCLCPLLTVLKVYGSYSLDALNSTNAAEACAEPSGIYGGAAAQKLQCTSRRVFPQLEFLRLKGVVQSNVLDRFRNLDDANASYHPETWT
jgi:hypothetical protein